MSSRSNAALKAIAAVPLVYGVGVALPEEIRRNEIRRSNVATYQRYIRNNVRAGNISNRHLSDIDMMKQSSLKPILGAASTLILPATQIIAGRSDAKAVTDSVAMPKPVTPPQIAATPRLY